MFDKKLIFVIFSLYVLFARGLFKENQIIIYIDNHILDFRIGKDKITTNNIEMNSLLMNEDANQIRKWLPRARVNDREGNIYLNRYYIIDFKSHKPDISKTIIKFENLSIVRIAEKIPILYPSYVPNDELWEEQYALRQIQADVAYELWDIDGGEIPGYLNNHEILVGIVDLGLMWDHPDLINNIWRNLGEDFDGDGDVLSYVDGEWIFDSEDINNVDDDGDGYIDNFIGYDVFSDDNDPHTGEQHGTLVAGCVSSQTNNFEGIASVGWSVKLVGINSGSGGTLPSGYEGVLAGAHMGVDIINCSWGMSSYLESNEAIVNTVYNQYGCMLVAAAGNYGVNEPHYPASYDNVISVTATSPGNNFNCWPNFHTTVDISSPGQDIITTANSSNLYDTVTGTSFSSPIVSGSIALIKSIFPYADNTMLRSKILLSASYFNDMDGDCGDESLEGLLGAGQIDIYQAILFNIEPEFSVENVTILNENGMQLPGDTTTVLISIKSLSGYAPTENIVANLTTNDTLLTVLEGEYVHDSIVGSGNTFDCQFIITSSDDMTFGNIPFSLTITADISGNFPSNLNFDHYSFESEIFLPFGYYQEGYPIDDLNIQGVLLFTDLYGNSLNQIYFGSDSMLHGKWISGYDVVGFPFNSNSKITTTSSTGDLDSDGDKELIFGTEDGTIFALNKDGTEYFTYSQNEKVIEFPVLYDLDNNGLLETIFISVNDSISTVSVIDNNGEILYGFPFIISEIINVGPAAADLNADGYGEIVIATQGGNIYVVDIFGEILDGFPFNIYSEPNGAPSLVDINNEIGIEILISSENNGIYILNHNGTIYSHLNDLQGIVSSISIADLDRNGNLELIFTSSDQLIHAYDPLIGSEIEGWPYQLDDNSVGEPIINNFDGDNHLEIMVATIKGNIFLINHDGSIYENFPYITQDSIFHTPTAGDLDLDGDFEIIFSTQNKLNVLDLDNSMIDQYSWNSYRSNNHRNGYFEVSLSELSLINGNNPDNFILGNNFPNPFNSSTKISYSLPIKGHVIVNIYDLNGRIVKNLFQGEQTSGRKTIVWSGTNEIGRAVSSGIYFYEMQVRDFIKTKKMVLMK